jgi:hypothetical protein
VAGSHERMPNREGHLILAEAFRVPFKPPLKAASEIEFSKAVA